MNWVWGMGFFLLCTAVGVGIYQRSAAKVRFYHALIGFCQHLTTEIGFALKPLPQIVAAYPPTPSTAFNQVLSGYAHLLQSKADLTREQCLALTTDAEVAAFLYGLGRTGSTQEKTKIANAMQIFTAKKTQAETYLHHKASIICKLLIIIGIAGVILWI